MADIEKIPSIPLEEYEVPLEESQSELGIKNEYIGSLDYGVLGSGQCGCRLAKSFYDIGYKKTLALNTAEVDLKPLTLPDEQKLLIGNIQGTGKDMGKGKMATEESQQVIFDKMKLIFGVVDKIVICVGAGGGTGSGGLSILIDIATKYLDFLNTGKTAKDIIVLTALPTMGELKSGVIAKNNSVVKSYINRKAEEGTIGPIFLMDNSKIEKMYKGIPPIKFWSVINDSITGLFHMFNYLSKQQSSYTSFDEEDYRNVMSTSGLGVIGVTKVKDTTLSQALQDNFKKTVLASNMNFGSAQTAACILVVNDKILESMPMDTINYGFDAVHNLLGSATVFRGLYGTTEEDIRAYTLVTGLKSEKTDAYA